jgi:hypothetical protein
MGTQGVASLLVMVSAGVALGCSGTNAEEEERQHWTRTVHRAEEIWHEKAPANYVFVQAFSCFCDDTLPVRIVVENGLVASATFADGTPAPARRALTIDGYFSVIKDWIGRNPDELEMTYDETLGFPREITVDFFTKAVDDENGFSISCFSANPADLESACPLSRQ